VSPEIKVADIWNYPDRSLSKYFSIFERAKGYTATPSKVFDEKRYIGILALLGDGVGAVIKYPDDDGADKGNWSVITNPVRGTPPQCVIDHNDSSDCEWSIAPGVSVDLLRLELPTIQSGFFRIVYFASSNLLVLEIHGSANGSTWTYLTGANKANNSIEEVLLYVPGYKYYKLVAYNSSDVSRSIRLYTVELYPAIPMPIVKEYESGARIMAIAHNGHYYLAEVIRV
jgi:hypothetical protein